jgi:hypothetical protein
MFTESFTIRLEEADSRFRAPWGRPSSRPWKAASPIWSIMGVSAGQSEGVYRHRRGFRTRDKTDDDTGLWWNRYHSRYEICTSTFAPLGGSACTARSGFRGLQGLGRGTSWGRCCYAGTFALRNLGQVGRAVARQQGRLELAEAIPFGHAQPLGRVVEASG